MELSYKVPAQFALLIQQHAQLHSPGSMNDFWEYLRHSPQLLFIPFRECSHLISPPSLPEPLMALLFASSKEPEILLKAISCGNCSRIKWELEAPVQHCLATCCWGPITSHPSLPSHSQAELGRETCYLLIATQAAKH